MSNRFKHTNTEMTGAFFILIGAALFIGCLVYYLQKLWFFDHALCSLAISVTFVAIGAMLITVGGD